MLVATTFWFPYRMWQIAMRHGHRLGQDGDEEGQARAGRPVRAGP